MANLGALGVPGTFVATREFIDGAAAQAKALGVDPAAVYVSHPIQDRSDAEMREIAAAAASAIEDSLLTGSTHRID